MNDIALNKTNSHDNTNVINNSYNEYGYGVNIGMNSNIFMIVQYNR